jgi:hypothetical protein
LSSPRFDEIYADDPWVTIRLDRDRRCLHTEWKGFATSVEYRAGITKVLDAVREAHATSMLADTRKLELVSSEDQLWIRDTWVPLVAAAGMKRIALVVAAHGLGRFAVESLNAQVGDEVFVRATFESMADATEWLAADQPHKARP